MEMIMDEYEEAAWAGINDGLRARGLPELDYTRLGFTQRDVDPLGNGDTAQRCNGGCDCDPYPNPVCAGSVCRLMITRRCPQSYGEHGCGAQPCARIESDDETPWLEELGAQASDQAKYDENVLRSPFGSEDRPRRGRT